MLSSHKFVRAVVASMCCAAAMFSVFALSTSPAAAEKKCTYVNYVLTCTEVNTGGTPGQPGGGGSDNEPTCAIDSLQPTEFDKGRTANFCDGTRVCYTRNLLPPLLPPDGEKPNEDSVARSTLCSDGFTISVLRVFWSDDEEPPTLLEQARTAIAALDFTTPTVGVSPAARTLVNLDTWFWLEGVQRDVSATAFTVTATATLQSMSVDPGDGSATFACTPVATTAAEAQRSCLHEYRKASVRGSTSIDGRPAYGVTITTVYGLTFTDGGGPLQIAGTPATLNGPPSNSAVRVDEVQTLSRPNG